MKSLACLGCAVVAAHWLLVLLAPMFCSAIQFSPVRVLALTVVAAPLAAALAPRLARSFADLVVSAASAAAARRHSLPAWC